MTQYDFVIKHAKRGEKVREIYCHLRVEFWAPCVQCSKFLQHSKRVSLQHRQAWRRKYTGSNHRHSIGTCNIPCATSWTIFFSRDIAKTLNSNPATIYGDSIQAYKVIPHLLLKVQKKKSSWCKRIVAHPKGSSKHQVDEYLHWWWVYVHPALLH